MLRLSFFNKKKSHFEYLHSKWSQRHKELQENLWTKHGDTIHSFLSKPQNLAMSTLAGMVLLTTTPANAMVSSNSASQVQQSTFREIDPNTFMMSDLANVLPSQVQPLTSDQENKITDMLSKDFNLSVKAELNGIRLDRNYGLIGKEQHLARFPGDQISIHFDSSGESDKYADTGMAPGLGAWGYFASSQSELTSEDDLREKYYIAVPTFLAPNFNENVATYSAFFKYRKMLVVNPDNGKAIIADIADSGPAPFTGKNLGGSPEVMDYLERVDGAQKGPVLYFFIDDPNNTVSLGPISMK